MIFIPRSIASSRRFWTFNAAEWTFRVPNRPASCFLDHGELAGLTESSDRSGYLWRAEGNPKRLIHSGLLSAIFSLTEIFPCAARVVDVVRLFSLPDKRNFLCDLRFKAFDCSSFCAPRYTVSFVNSAQSRPTCKAHFSLSFAGHTPNPTESMPLQYYCLCLSFCDPLRFRQTRSHRDVVVTARRNQRVRSLFYGSFCVELEHL